MKSTLFIITLAGATLFSNLAQARAGWTDYVTVAELIPTNRHYFEVRLPVKKNPSGCSENRWLYQNYGSPGSDKMFDTLLEGIKSGIRVRVYATGICNVNGYSEFSSLSVIR